MSHLFKSREAMVMFNDGAGAEQGVIARKIDVAIALACKTEMRRIFHTGLKPRDGSRTMLNVR